MRKQAYKSYRISFFFFENVKRKKKMLRGRFRYRAKERFVQLYKIN